MGGKAFAQPAALRNLRNAPGRWGPVARPRRATCAIPPVTLPCALAFGRLARGALRESGMAQLPCSSAQPTAHPSVSRCRTPTALGDPESDVFFAVGDLTSERDIVAAGVEVTPDHEPTDAPSPTQQFAEPSRRSALRGPVFGAVILSAVVVLCGLTKQASLVATTSASPCVHESDPGRANEACLGDATVRTQSIEGAFAQRNPGRGR